MINTNFSSYRTSESKDSSEKCCLVYIYERSSCMYVQCDNEEIYKEKSFELIKQFDIDTQKKAVKAIDDLFSSEFKISWRFISVALTKKSKDNYCKYGFGLWFNKGFISHVYAQIEREESTKDIDLNKFFNTKEELDLDVDDLF